MKNIDIIDILEKKRKSAYQDQNSIQKELDEFLLLNGIYHTFDTETFFKKISGKVGLSSGIINIFEKAIYMNEKLYLLEMLLSIGHDKDYLTVMALDCFKNCNESDPGWEFGDLLYRLKNFKFVDAYIEIALNDDYGTSRQRIVELLGKSKSKKIKNVFEQLLEDSDVSEYIKRFMS